MRALRKLQRESEASPFVFVSERGAPFSTAGFARMLERAAETARLEIKAHPHMLRHACGFKLANDGVDTRALQAYLGHKSMAPRRESQVGGRSAIGARSSRRFKFQ
jgi:type 1 fimbriae regulatory protein FimB/type 1 fimbriae regulatory protein FimE